MYGYRIESGKAVIDENEACILNTMFHNYLNGMSLTEAAETAGLHNCHSQIKKMLQREIYLGDQYYPPIIDKALFALVQTEIEKRSAAHCQRGKKDVSNRVSFMISAWIFLQNNLKIQQNRQNTYTV